MSPSVFALLDDLGVAGAAPLSSSRLYTDWAAEHRCDDPATLDTVWAAVEADQRRGCHAVVLADYEWGVALQGLGLETDRPGCLRVLMFRRLQWLDAEATETWLRQQEGEGAAEAKAPGVAGVIDLRPSVDEAGFHAAIDAVQVAIRAGETYQVNYTYRLQGQAYGDPVALYRRLRQRQPVAFGALIALPTDPVDPDDSAEPAVQPGAQAGQRFVLSLSPELFLSHRQGLLTARPMKGTAPRDPDPERDVALAKALAADVKNRAENLMIVDLLRNDLGRIARIGSVSVPALFHVEHYATVHQMTSTVQAEVLPEVDLPGLLRASFPCGSITGAPKLQTMGLIRQLETTPRGLYCGAIGWLEAPAPGRRLGDLCLSVAIRTLVLDAPSQGLRRCSLGVGAGIVLDSVATDEFAECRLKARFLTGLDPGFELFETLRQESDGAQPLRQAHLQRLAHSASVLGFAFDPLQAAALLDAAAAGGGLQRLRLALSADGQLRLTQAALPGLPAAWFDASGRIALRVSAQILPLNDPLAAHKTSRRAHYDLGVREAEQAQAFDSLFFNQAGCLVEGGRSSVFVRLGGRWFTPPLADGALPGVQRAALLADPAWAASERSLQRDELAAAEALLVCNALRGVLPARLVSPMPGPVPGPR